jgi:hypothetical protein
MKDNLSMSEKRFPVFLPTSYSQSYDSSFFTHLNVGTLQAFLGSFFMSMLFSTGDLIHKLGFSYLLSTDPYFHIISSDASALQSTWPLVYLTLLSCPYKSQYNKTQLWSS